MSWIEEAGKKISGSVKTGAGELADFVKDPVEGFKNMGEELQRWRDNVRDLEPAGVSEELWGEGGRFAYPAGAAVMSKRSPTGEPLSDEYKSALKPFFGDLVDKVTIHWATPPLDEWAADRFRIKLEDTDTIAQTFGHDIYIKYGKGEQSKEEDLSLLAHELVHAQQFEKHGRSFSDFGYHYFKRYKKANLSYKENDMEDEAYQREEEFVRAMQLASKPGSLRWYRHNGWQDGSGSWVGYIAIGHDWQEYSSVFASSNGVIYGIASNGDLYWYRHDDWRNGSSLWKGRKKVGNGWQSYKSVFATSNGVIYAIANNGDLHWYRHDGWQNGEARWAGEKKIGHGWHEYKSVFGTSSGVMYGITKHGDLYWYEHKGWKEGSEQWAGRNLIGHGGWQDYKSVFASSNGTIYGVTHGGDLYWYRHDGWQNGAKNWKGRQKVGHGWQTYKSIFATENGVLYGIMP